MKIKAMKYILAVAMCLFMQPVLAEGRVMFEPVLGLKFNPDTVQIEKAPAGAVKALPYTKGGTYWVFARFDDSAHSGNVYMLVSGISPVMSDIAPYKVVSMEADTDGTVIAKHGTNYKVLGVEDGLFNGYIKLEDSIVQGLADDAIRRLILIFGGKTALRDEIQKQWKRKPEVEKPVLNALKKAGVADYGN
jgi:hypothetical protein